MVLLDGRVAVVTCAGQGIDAAIARGLRSPGAQVVVSDINGDADMSVATDAAPGGRHCTRPWAARAVRQQCQHDARRVVAGGDGG